MTIFHHTLLTREGRFLANGWTHPSSMTIFVDLFIRSVFRKVTTMTLEYHMTLNIIFSSVVVFGSGFAAVLSKSSSLVACESPSILRTWRSALCFPSDVVSNNYVNFQLPSACCLHCWIHLLQLKWALTTEASQRTQILPSSLHLFLCSWAEGFICETSLLTCCVKW